MEPTQSVGLSTFYDSTVFYVNQRLFTLLCNAVGIFVGVLMTGVTESNYLSSFRTVYQEIPILRIVLDDLLSNSHVF